MKLCPVRMARGARGKVTGTKFLLYFSLCAASVDGGRDVAAVDLWPPLPSMECMQPNIAVEAARCAGLSVEQEKLRTLSRHNYRLANYPVNGDVDKRRLRRHVIIPDVMMRGLKAPTNATRARVQRHD